MENLIEAWLQAEEIEQDFECLHDEDLNDLNDFILKRVEAIQYLLKNTSFQQLGDETLNIFTNEDFAKSRKKLHQQAKRIMEALHDKTPEDLSEIEASDPTIILKEFL